MKSLVIAFLIFISSCTSSKEFNDQIQVDNCEEALRQAPHKQNDFRLISETQKAAGTLLSYSATGAAYTADILLYVTGSAMINIVVCSPFYIMDSALGANNELAKSCQGEALDYNWKNSYGKNTFSATKSLRCPRVDTISQAIRKVAGCYLKKGGSENYDKAVNSLQSIYTSQEFYSCLTPPERQAFEKDLALAEKFQYEKASGL